jgi:hypothetical protein
VLEYGQRQIAHERAAVHEEGRRAGHAQPGALLDVCVDRRPGTPTVEAFGELLTIQLEVGRVLLEGGDVQVRALEEQVVVGQNCPCSPAPRAA